MFLTSTIQPTSFGHRFPDRLSAQNLELYKNFAKEALKAERSINRKLSVDIGSGVSLKAKVSNLLFSVKKGSDEFISEIKRDELGTVNFKFTLNPKEKADRLSFVMNYDKPYHGMDAFELMSVTDNIYTSVPSEIAVNNSLKKFLPALTERIKKMKLDITV